MPLTHLHILGPNLQNNYLESRFSLATGKRLLQIGDGIRIIDLDEIEDAIKQYSIEYNDPNPINYSTYIYIHMHGGLYMEPLNINLIKHYVSLNPTGYRYTKTRDLFLVLSKWAHGSNVQIHLDSCYSGMAIQDLDVFADGTVALAFAAKYYASHSYKETKIIKNVNSDYSIIKNLLSSLVDNVTPTGVLGYKNNGAVHELEFSLPLTLATSTKIAEHHLSEMRKDLINFVYKHNLVPKYIDAKFMNIEAKIFSEKQLQHHAGRMILWRGNIIGNKHPLSSIARYATSMLFDLNQNYFYDHKFFKLITDKPDIIAKISQFDYPFYHFGNKVLIDLLLSQLNSANQVSHQQALSNKQELSMRAHAELSRTYNASALNGKTNTDHAIAIRKLMDINSRLANESDTINIKALTMIRNELTSKYNNNQLEVIYTEILRLTLIHSISSTDPVEIATFSSLMTKKIQQLLIITENFHIYRYKRLLLLATSQHNLQEQFDTELSKFPGIGRNILPLLNKILTSFNSLSILKINSLYHKAEKITLKRQMLNDILTKRSSSNDEIKAKIDNFLAAVLTEKNEFRKLFHYIDNVFFKATLQQLLQITAIKEAVINNFKAELTLIGSEISLEQSMKKQKEILHLLEEIRKITEQMPALQPLLPLDSVSNTGRLLINYTPYFAGWIYNSIEYLSSTISWAAFIVGSVPGMIANAITGITHVEVTVESKAEKLAPVKNNSLLAAHIDSLIGIRAIQQRFTDTSLVIISENKARTLAMCADPSPHIQLIAVTLKIGVNMFMATKNAIAWNVGPFITVNKHELSAAEAKLNKIISTGVIEKVSDSQLYKIQSKLLQILAAHNDRKTELSEDVYAKIYSLSKLFENLTIDAGKLTANLNAIKEAINSGNNTIAENVLTSFREDMAVFCTTYANLKQQNKEIKQILQLHKDLATNEANDIAILLPTQKTGIFTQFINTISNLVSGRSYSGESLHNHQQKIAFDSITSNLKRLDTLIKGQFVSISLPENFGSNIYRPNILHPEYTTINNFHQRLGELNTKFKTMKLDKTVSEFYLYKFNVERRKLDHEIDIYVKKHKTKVRKKR